MNDEKRKLIIDIANDMKDKNSDLAEKICNDVVDHFDIRDMKDQDISIILCIGVRKWTDLLSCWGFYQIASWWITTQTDLYKCKQKFDDLIDGNLE